MIGDVFQFIHTKKYLKIRNTIIRYSVKNLLIVFVIVSRDEKLVCKKIVLHLEFYTTLTIPTFFFSKQYCAALIVL